NRLLVCALNFDAMGFDTGIVLESLMNNAPVERAQGFQLNDVPPASNFLGGVLGLLHQSLSRLGPVTAHVYHDFRRGRILLEKEPVGDVLQVRERLSLAADETAGILSLHIEKDTVFQMMLLNSDGETEKLQDFLQGVFGFSRHDSWCVKVADRY